MKVILENDAGEQTELVVGTDMVVGDVRITVSKYVEPTYYDPINISPGSSGAGGGAGE